MSWRNGWAGTGLGRFGFPTFLATGLLAVMLGLPGCGVLEYGSGPYRPVPASSSHDPLGSYRINGLPDQAFRVSVYSWAYAPVPEQRCRDLVLEVARLEATQGSRPMAPDLASLRARSGHGLIAGDCAATIEVRPSAS